MRHYLLAMLLLLLSANVFSQTSYYVNDNSTLNDGFTTAVGNDLNSGTSASPFATVAKALLTAAAGDIIYVDAGTYAENVVINKSITLRGAYAGVAPGTSLSRGAETIFLPSANDINNGSVFSVNATNITIDGFTLNGDNSSISGGISLNGVDLNAGFGIYNQQLLVDGLSVKNNIIRNFNRYAVFLSRVSQPTKTENNSINNNRCDNIGNRGIGLFNNAYSGITNNTITRAVNYGILLANGTIESSLPINITGNTIESNAINIGFNVMNASAPSINISSNTLTPNPGGSGGTGISVAFSTSSGSIQVSNNFIAGKAGGIDISNCNTPTTIAVNGGSVTNCTTSGINIGFNNAAGGISVNGSSVTNANVGLFLTGTNNNFSLNNVNLTSNPVGIDASSIGPNMQVSFSNVSIVNGITGIRFYGNGLLLPGNALTGVYFTNQTTDYIYLTSNAFNGQAIDASTVFFDGVTPNSMTQAQLFATEDKIRHRVDYNDVGLFKLKPNKVYVTPNSFSASLPPSFGVATTSPDINRAIAAAAANDTVYIAEGNYANQITIDKGIALIGEGQNQTTITNNPAVALVAPPGNFAEIGLIQTAQNIGDVHIIDMSVYPALGSIPYMPHPIAIQSGGSVKGCKIMNGGQGVFFRIQYATKTALIENNNITAEYIGINCEGSGLTTILVNNSINITNPGFSAGAFIGADGEGFSPLSGFIAAGNFLTSYVTSGFQVNSNNVNITQNSFLGSGLAIQQTGSSNLLSAPCNWYGSANVNVVVPKIQGNINYSPWLSNGTDNDPAIGFQAAPGACNTRQNKFYVNDNSQAGDVFTTAIGNNSNSGLPSAPFATISTAFSRASSGDTIFVDAGTYIAADGTLSKPITILGTNYLNIPNSPANPLLINSTRNAETIIENTSWTIGANEISLEGLTFNPLGKQQLTLNNASFSNIYLFKNRFKITAGLTQLNFLGLGNTNTTLTGIANSGLQIAENRFEKYDASSGLTLNINRFRNVGIVGNSFVVEGATLRTQSVLNIGSSGVVDGVYVGSNHIDNHINVVSGSRYGILLLNDNKIHNTNNAFNSTNISTESSNVYFINNLLDGSAGVSPFIQYNRQGGSVAGSSSSFTAENNIITANAVPGTTSLLGNMNIIFLNTVLNPSVVVRGNTMTYTGDLSTVEGQFIRPIMLRGNVANAIVEKNEITLNGTNLRPKNPTADLPVCPAITLYTDNGTTSELLTGAVINILNNKIHGFKHSFVAYDPAVGSTPYTGFGNIPAGVTVNVNNNSFTGDSISINCGTVGQQVLASCNWYGTAIKETIESKVSNSTVQNIPWLTNGTDNDAAIGFQPVPGACNGYQRKLYVNDNSQTGDVFTLATGNNANTGTQLAPFATLNYALSVAEAGDSIFVDAGTYVTPNLTINKSVTILGTNYTISPNNTADRLAINPVRNAEALITGSTFTIASNDVRLEGLAFEPGAKQQVFTGNSGVNNFTFKRNYSKITTGGAFLNLNGPSSTPSGQASAFGNYLIEDNRFESFSSAICYAVGLGALNDVTVNNNAFISLPSTTPKMLINTFPGLSGLTVNLVYTNNIAFASRADLFCSGPVGSTRIENNISLQGQRAFVIQPSNVISYDMQVRNNYIETDIAEISPIHFTASGNITTTSLTNLLIENNTIIQNPMGRSSVSAGISAYTSFGSGNSSIIRRNKISFNGDFSSFTSSNVHGINYAGYWHTTNFNENEITFNGINLTNATPVSGPISSGINISPDNGESSYLPSTAVINITGNKINNFKNSVAVFDQTNRSGNTFVGYGNLPAGVALTINNNSFTGDVISINNGTTGQQAQAGCNWYGSASLQNIMSKVTVQTVAYTPYLTNGTDNDLVTTGFQPVPGSCNNYPINVVVDSYTNVTCYGANNGAINITVSGGSAPYTFAWTKDGTPSFTSAVEDPTNFGPGTYHLSITDALGTNLIMDQNGNIITIDVIITEPSVLTAAATGTNVNCFNGSNGTATVLATGGTAPYSYLWSNGATASSINGLIQSNYTVTVTDAKGCTATSNYNVTQPALLTAAGNGTNLSCFNGSNGTATVNVTGGTTPYSYLWNNAATTSSINGLTQGNYTVTITDANGCVTNASYNVTQPPVLNVTLTGTTASCNGSTTVNPTGGTYPYTYLWNNGATTKTISNVPAGTYTVVVTDANGCTKSGSYTITGNSPINPITTLVAVSCFGGNNGSITVTGAGGTAPHTYNINGGAFQAGNVFSNLTAGVYIIGAKDANGCSDFVSKTISQPSASVTVALDSTKNPCYGVNNGRIYITAAGPLNKTYSWTGPNGYTSTTQDPNNLAPGEYNLAVLNSNGCTASLTVTLASWPAVTISGIVTDIKCKGDLSGAIDATINGGTGSGFTLSWNGPGTIVPPPTEDISSLKSGDYILSVTDAGSGCLIKDTFTVTQPATAVNVTAAIPQIVTCAGSIATATGSNGTPPYEYSFDGGAYQTANTFTIFTGGDHTVTIRDANGCTKTIIKAVTDNGKDAYEGNNSKGQSKLIDVGTVINGRIATAADGADWFKFTTSTAGAYTLTFTHPSANFVFNVYSTVNNSPALVAVSTTATTKQYNLNAATTYHVQITGGLSYSCYSLLVSLGAPPVMNRFAPTEIAETPAPAITVKTIEAKLYPNPHQGVFNLQISSPEDAKATIQIITVDGKVILTREVRLQKGNGNIEGFSGLYQSVLFYRIITDNKTLSGKIIGPN